MALTMNNEHANERPSEGDANVRELGYSYDLLYGIKNPDQLHAEIEYLAHRLSGLMQLCREDGYSVDAYVAMVLSCLGAHVARP